MRWALRVVGLLLLVAGIALIALGAKLVGFIIIVVLGISVAGSVGGMAGAAGGD